MLILCINAIIAVKKIRITMPYNRIVQQIIKTENPYRKKMLLITIFAAN
jgi:hypothetical protein